MKWNEDDRPRVKILSATLIQGSGPDTILLEVDLPNGCWPYNGNQSVKMEVSAGSGIGYLEENLGIVPKVISETPEFQK